MVREEDNEKVSWWIYFFSILFTLIIINFIFSSVLPCDEEDECNIIVGKRTPIIKRFIPLYLFFGKEKFECERICWDKNVEVCDNGNCWYEKKRVWINKTVYDEKVEEETCIIQNYGLGIELRVKSNEGKNFDLYLDNKSIGNFDTEYDDFYGWHKHFGGNQGCNEKYDEAFGRMCLGRNLGYKTEIRIEYDNKTIEDVFGCYKTHMVRLE